MTRTIVNSSKASTERSGFAYRSSGLRLSSDVALPGLVPLDDDAGEYDAVIRYGEAPAALDAATAAGPGWEMSGDRFLLRIAGVARFLLTAGREIIVAPEPEAEEADLAIFLIGTVFGILLHQRQHIVLHASAVRVGGKAVLFCGPSGAGKSTTAAALAQRGLPLITDDVCTIAFPQSGAPMVQPDGRLLKLWDRAIEKLDLAEDRGKPVRSQLKKYFVEPPRAHVEALPLGAVYMLREARPPHEAGIKRPNIVDTALLLRRNAYRPLLVRRMGQANHYFQAAAAMANAAGIFHLTRAMDFDQLPEVLSRLERHWVEIGLLAAS